MKYLVCITKTAEIEVDLDRARHWLEYESGHDITDWPDEEICETFLAEQDDDPEFSTYVTIVTELEEEQS